MCNSKSCVSVTSPSDPIAIASVSEAEHMLPASAITNRAISYYSTEVIAAPEVIALLNVA